MKFCVQGRWASTLVVILAACVPESPEVTSPATGSRRDPLQPGERYSARWSDSAPGARTEAGSLVDIGPDGQPLVPGLVDPTDANGQPYQFEMRSSEDRPALGAEHVFRVFALETEPIPFDDRRERYMRHRGEVAEEAISARLAQLPDPLPLPTNAATVDATTASWTARGGVNSRELLVGLMGDPGWSVEAETRRAAIVEGLSPEEERNRREQLVLRFQGDVEALQADLVAFCRSIGVDVLESFWVTNMLRVRATPTQLAQLLLRSEVKRVEDATALLGEEAVDNWEAAKGKQALQFIEQGYDGARANPSRHSWGRMAISILDSSFEDDIVPLLDAGGGSSRVIGMHDCTGSPCVDAADMVPNGAHGTMVTAIAAADLLDGQDPGMPLVDKQKRRSGVAREGGLFLMKHSLIVAALIRTLQLSASKQVDVANLSGGVVAPGSCSGVGLLSAAVDDVSRLNGVLVVKSAGNQGHAPPQSCNVSDPGGAAFPVVVGGSLNGCVPPAGDNCPAANWTCVQTGPIYDLSSHGAEPYLLGTRALIDMVTPAYLDTTVDDTGAYVCTPGGTSFSAPQVTGAAAAFRDWWIASGAPSGTYNSPGLMQAALLLMGDRIMENGGTRESSIDPLWGSGRFRMRRFDTVGMDAPWGFAAGSTVVNNGQTTVVPLNGGAQIPAGVDQLKVVAWWPEPNLANAGQNGADIVLQVRSTCGPFVQRFDDTYDTHKMVYINSFVASRCFEMRLNGFSVPANPWEGNATKRTVYWAAFWEDTARDDADGPPSDIQ